MNKNLQESSISIRDHRTSKYDKFEEENYGEHNLFLECSLWPKIVDFLEGWRVDYNMILMKRNDGN